MSYLKRRNRGAFNRAINLLEELFGEDSEAREAITFLAEKGEHLDWPEEREEEEKGGNFSLPEEVTSEEGSYALFSDGACRGNPGPGAWAVMGQNCRGAVLFQASGVDVQTTNNRMELEGAIRGLEALEEHLEESGQSAGGVFLFSDSQYVVEGIKEWVPKWKKRNWKKADKKVPSNVGFVATFGRGIRTVLRGSFFVGLRDTTGILRMSTWMVWPTVP